MSVGLFLVNLSHVIYRFHIQDLVNMQSSENNQIISFISLKMIDYWFFFKTSARQISLRKKQLIFLRSNWTMSFLFYLISSGCIDTSVSDDRCVENRRWCPKESLLQADEPLRERKRITIRCIFIRTRSIDWEEKTICFSFFFSSSYRTVSLIFNKIDWWSFR